MAAKVSKRFAKQEDLVIPSKGSYWDKNGSHEHKLETLDVIIRKLVDNQDNFDWSDEANDHWALFVGMKGIYYAHYNDGDNIRGAIENNRVYGYRSFEAFERLARSLDAHNVLLYMKMEGDKERLERAMNEAILIAWKYRNE